VGKDEPRGEGQGEGESNLILHLAPHFSEAVGNNSADRSPLQTRTQFLKNRGWQLVISLNRAACERGRAQHGFNTETQAAVESEWGRKEQQILSLEQTIEFLRYCHRRAPFLFFNGNTFAEIGRQMTAALFADFSSTRRREVASAVAHYIAGVLDREMMVEIVETLWQNADLQPGDRVKTLRSSLRGVILRRLDDGRVAWQPDGSESELTSLPESLLPDRK